MREACLRPPGGGRLRQWVDEDFGVELAELDPVGHGADHRAQLWRGTCADGTSYAVKLTTGGTSGGLVLTAYLAGLGVEGVPGPVSSREGLPWSERSDGRLSLQPWVPGRRALDGGMSAEHWRSLGELLAQVHAVPVKPDLSTALPVEDHCPDRHSAALRAVEARVRAVPAPTDLDEPLDPLVLSLVRDWSVAAHAVAALLRHTEALGQRMRRGAPPAVLCHGDPHLGNLLHEPSGHVWLVDWDDAMLAPRERDLMLLIGGGVLDFAPVTPEQEGWFFEGYGPVDLDGERLAYYQCVRAIEDLVDPAAQVLDAAKWSEEERREALGIVTEVLSPTGLVRRAVRSVRGLP